MKKVYEYEQVQAFRENPDQLAELLSDVVNGGFDKEKFAEALMRRHRTLQQQVFGIMFNAIRKWRDAWNEGSFDLRNEFTCETSSIMARAAEEWYGYAEDERITPPFI